MKTTQEVREILTKKTFNSVRMLCHNRFTARVDASPFYMAHYTTLIRRALGYNVAILAQTASSNAIRIKFAIKK